MCIFEIGKEAVCILGKKFTGRMVAQHWIGAAVWFWGGYFFLKLAIFAKFEWKMGENERYSK